MTSRQATLERHGDGPLHFACDLHGVHFAIYQSKYNGAAPAQEYAGATKLGFNVDDVDAFYTRALELGAKSKLAPDNAPWGRNAVVIDLDGRTIEFNGLIK